MQPQQLEVFTLGRFLVKRGSKVLSEEFGRSHRLWTLFNYLITHRGKMIPAEVLIETLWPEEELANPKSALRSIIYRLRRLLENSTNIIASQGAYGLNVNGDYWLDVEIFQRLCQEAHQLADIDQTEAINTYQQGLALYQGDYLAHCPYEEWTMVVRDYYRRIYLDGVLELCGLLKNAHRYQELRKICTDSFLVEPFCQELHEYYIDALAAEGKTSQAQHHYEYASSLLYRECGIQPSLKMRELYRQLKQAHGYADTNLLQPEARGALVCTPGVFRALYELENRRQERKGQPVFLECLTIAPPNCSPEAMDELQESLRSNLRKGDVVCRWSENQFLLLLTGLERTQAGNVIDRIKNSLLPYDIVYPMYADLSSPSSADR